MKIFPCFVSLQNYWGFSFPVFLRSGRLPCLKHPGFMVVFFDLDFWGIIRWSPFLLSPLTSVSRVTTSKSSLHSGSWKTFPQALQTQFCWVNWTKGEELAPPTIWALYYFLFLLLPEEDSHSDLLFVFVTSKVGDTSPSKEAALRSLENCSSCLCLTHFGLWIPKGQRCLSKSLVSLATSAHSPLILQEFPAGYSWKWEFQYYSEPRCNQLHSQQNSPVRKEKVFSSCLWKC